jgi:hypothetical protein
MLECKHKGIVVVRERMRNAILGSSSYAFMSLRFDEEALEAIIEGLVTITTATASDIMIEHGDEIIAEYKRIMGVTK